MADRSRSPWSPRIGGFLLAETLSAIGTFATMIAIWAYAAYRYDASPGEIALYGIAFTLPGVFLGPISGVVIDRIGSRRVLVGAKALGVVASLALIGAHSFGMLTLLSALHGVAGAFARPALTSMPPRMVDDEHLARTNALVGLTEQLSIVLGPVAAGIAIGAFGFKGAFVFDAATYALGIVVLPLVRLAPVVKAVDHAESLTTPWREAIAGWRIVAKTVVLRRVVMTTFVVHFLYGTALLAEPLYVRDVLERSTTVFAGLQTVFGVFLVAGGLIAARVGDRMATFMWVVGGVVASGFSALLYLGTGSLAVAVIGVSLWGVATALIWGPAHTVLQRSSPPSAHGRVMATDMLVANSAMFLGLGLAGVLIGAFGVPRTISGVALFVIGSGVALALADRRDHRSIEMPEMDSVGRRVEARQ
ncbi:MAG: MFS transporter [Actinobacteria bacterium]|nr:MFS transporter [Actinomycetota bacterium]